jgi:ubiquinone/menaquinone biosynthesis C-methylase UbiE
MERFARMLRVSVATRVLDVGGTPAIWRLSPVRPRLVILNIHGAGTTVIGDAKQMPFKDNSFDVVFSNSLIEHLPPGAWKSFAGECRRVGSRLWIEAPNPGFPFEPHFLTPVIHWLPMDWRVRVAPYTVRALLDPRPPAEYRDLAREVAMPTRRQMRSLFPDALIIPERWLGLTKAHIAIR